MPTPTPQNFELTFRVYRSGAEAETVSHSIEAADKAEAEWVGGEITEFVNAKLLKTQYAMLSGDGLIDPGEVDQVIFESITSD